VALDRALALRGDGAYVLQAAIASLHLQERSDWSQVSALYDRLLALTGSPVVALNRAVALAEAHGPQVGLEAIVGLDLELEGYHYLHATRADFLRRLDRREDARAAYTRALELVRSEPERRFLRRRVSQL
jgi:RNA polymerase sigma-70 factor (ECF subfamily)